MGTEFLGGHAEGLGGCPHNEPGPFGQVGDAFAHEVAQLPLDTIASIGALDFALGYDETDEAAVALLVGSDVDDNQWISCARSVSDRGGEIRWVNHAVRARQHRGVSGGQLGAALATAGSQNGAAGAGRHAQTEAVRLRTTTVVGLEGPLGGHGNSPRRGVVSHSLIGWAIDARGAIAGTHARNGRKHVPRLSGWARLVNAAGLPTASHTVSTAVEIAVEQPRPQRWMTKVIHRQCVFLLSAPRCGPKVVTTAM